MTLIELVIGIGIVLVFIVIAFPKGKVEKYQIDSFSRQLVSDIRYIRNINMNGKQSLYIEYITLTNPQSYVIKDNSNIVKSVSLPKNTKISCISNIIKFKSDGTLNSKGETIDITSKDTKVEITIIPFSGRVLLKEGKYAS